MSEYGSGFQLDLFGDYIDLTKHEPIDGNGELENGKENRMGRDRGGDDLRHGSAGQVENDGGEREDDKGNFEPAESVINGRRVSDSPVSALPETVQSAQGSGDAHRDSKAGRTGSERQGDQPDNGVKRDTTSRSAGDSLSRNDSLSAGTNGRGSLDYRISENDRIGEGNKAERFEANIAAITLLKNLENENRCASADEQKTLIKYTGWGGLSDAFRPDGDSRNDAWTRRTEQLKNLLSPEEHRAASSSTLNAHYTSPDIVDAVWSAAKRMGYNGGPTLEPAAGTGLFFAGRPADLPVKMYGVELDSISGRISQQLYQTADIRINGYEDIKLPANKYNLAISNVPFGGYQAYENRANKTPGVDNGHLIHDFYFLKSLHGVKEGGLVAFITSKGTLDKSDNQVRSQIAKTADFVGAIRLPNSAFKQMADTEVVADIVFLQKRSPAKEMSQLTKDFINTSPIKLNDAKGVEQTVDINSYFVAHPEMVLGEADLSGTMYGGNEYTVNLNRAELSERLNAAIKNLPENIMRLAAQEKTAEVESAFEATFTPRDQELPVNSYFVDANDKIRQWKLKPNGDIKPELHDLYDENGMLDTKGEKVISRVKGMIELRDNTRELFANQYNEHITPQIKQQRVALAIEQLNDIYDDFVKNHGNLNDPKNYGAFYEDPDSSLVSALEVLDKETGAYHKSDLFTGVNFAVNRVPDRVDSAIDAMSLSLTQQGCIDVGYMAQLTGREQNDLIRELVETKKMYPDHEQFKNDGEGYICADEYLSGNIRQKLRDVEKLLETDPRFVGNYDDLHAVMPRDLGPEEIYIKINSPILGEKHVKDFIKDTWGLGKDNQLNTEYLPMSGEWDVDIDYKEWEESGVRDADQVQFGYNGRVKSDRGRDQIATFRGQDLLKRILNDAPLTVKITYRDSNGDSVVDQEATKAATAIAEAKGDLIKDAFQKWLWKDPQRTNDIVTRYNEIFNSTVAREYVYPERAANPDAQIRFHGCAFHSPLRPNQADAVWRGIQQQNTMFAHAVGAGKTLEMACTAMESRRLGLCKKPLVVCPDHMIGQWAKEFREAYPAAKLLVADDVNWDKDNRKPFVNRIATGDWDAVIVRKTTFGMIPMSPEKQEEHFRKQIEIFRKQTKELGKERDWSHNKIEAKIKSYEARIEKLADSKKDDGVLYFDQLGIDCLIVDEADMYKNLEYTTTLKNVKGLNPQTGSQQAFDMYMKVHHTQENNGKVIFATGTPISNSLVEGYTMQRLLQPQELERTGLTSFDQWRRQYAEAVTTMELDNAGKGFKSTTRLSKVVNVPELVTSLRQAWDIKTPTDLERLGILVPGKNLPHKEVINSIAPPTPLLASYRDYLVERDDKARGQRTVKGGDNALVVIGDGRKAAVDLRLINPAMPDDPNSKLNKTVNDIVDVLKRHEKERYTAVVFIDKPCAYKVDVADGKEKKTVIFNVVDDMKKKLIALGVKPQEIAWTGESKYATSSKKYANRQELWDKVSTGKVRVLFGSTESMGAGTNFQKNAKAVFHLDPPWRPRDTEQRNGRLYRPGNETGSIEIYNCATKGSLDTRLYSILESKQKMIDQIMSGDKSVREFEEDYFSSVKELSLENEFVREKIELEQSIKRLKYQEYAHDTSVAKAHRDIKDFTESITNATNSYDKIKQDVERRVPEDTVKADSFRMVLDGTSYDKRKDAGTYIKEAVNADWNARKLMTERDIGHYAGYDLKLYTSCKPSLIDNAHYLEAFVSLKDTNNTYCISIRSIDDPVGLCTKLHNVIYNEMDKNVQAAKQRIDGLNYRHESNLQFINTSFEKKDELRSAQQRLNAVDNILNEQQRNEKQIVREDKFPWDKLDNMAPEEIHKTAVDYCAKEGYSLDRPFEIRRFDAPQTQAATPAASPPLSQIPQTPAKTAALSSTVNEINHSAAASQHLKERSGFVLNPGVASCIDLKIANNELDPHLLPKIIDRAHEDFKNGIIFTRFHSDNRIEYRQDSDLNKPPKNGDFFIRFDSKANTHQLYMPKKDSINLSKIREGSLDELENHVKGRMMNVYVGRVLYDVTELKKSLDSDLPKPEAKPDVDVTDVTD